MENAQKEPNSKIIIINIVAGWLAGKWLRQKLTWRQIIGKQSWGPQGNWIGQSEKWGCKAVTRSLPTLLGALDLIGPFWVVLNWDESLSFWRDSSLCSFSCSVAHLYPTLQTPWIVACQVPLSMQFSRQDYLNGLPFPPPGDLPNPGIKPISCSGRWILDHYATWETQQLFLAEGNFQRGPVKAAVIVVIPSAMESNHGGTIEYY